MILSNIKSLWYFFLQFLLKRALFKTTSISSPRVRILAVRKNKEVRQCLNKSDLFQLTSPKSLLPWWVKQLKLTQHHQHRSEGWGHVFLHTGKGKSSTYHEKGRTDRRNQQSETRQINFNSWKITESGNWINYFPAPRRQQADEEQWVLIWQEQITSNQSNFLLQ